MSNKLYCNHPECPVEDCVHNAGNADMSKLGEPYSVGHLEDNPLYCKKANWYGYQVKEEKDGRKEER